MDKELVSRVLCVIEEKHNKSNGKCGISPLNVSEKLEMKYVDLKEVFNHLYQTNQIKVRKGINSYLLFKP